MTQQGKITLATKSKGFTQIPNSILKSKTLSWKAKGLMSYLLTLDEDWTLYKSDLKNRATDGYDSMCSAFKELEDAGYITSITVRNDGGLFAGIEYEVHENPCLEQIEPIRENPSTVKPDAVNPQLINTSLNNKKSFVFKEKIEERIAAFRRELYPYVRSGTNIDGYDAELVREFFDYWSESNGKTFRREREDFFDIKRRLSTFKKKGDAIKEKYNSNGRIVSHNEITN